MHYCPKCKTHFIYDSQRANHICPPIWYVHLLGYDNHDEATPTYADNAADAAQLAAEISDRDDNEFAILGANGSTPWYGTPTSAILSTSL